MSDDEFSKVTEQLKDVFRTERNSQKDKLVSNISSKMETAGFVPAFLDGNFKSEYVNFKIEFFKYTFPIFFFFTINMRYIIIRYI